MKSKQIPQKLVFEKFYVREEILRTRNCRRNFIKSLTEKCKENIRNLNRHWIRIGKIFQ